MRLLGWTMMCFFKTIFDKFFSGCEQLECQLYKKMHETKKTPQNRDEPTVAGTVTPPSSGTNRRLWWGEYLGNGAAQTQVPMPMGKGWFLSLHFVTMHVPLRFKWAEYMMVYCGVAIKPFLVFFWGDSGHGHRRTCIFSIWGENPRVFKRTNDTGWLPEEGTIPKITPLVFGRSFR